jgi:hypothetical protein
MQALREARVCREKGRAWGGYHLTLKLFRNCPQRELHVPNPVTRARLHESRQPERTPVAPDSWCA